MTLSVELDDQRPHLSRQVNMGFSGFKDMIKKLLDEGKKLGEIKKEIDTEAATEMLFSGMLGASVQYGTEKSTACLDLSISALIQCLERLAP